jgi:hypothetical protein
MQQKIAIDLMPYQMHGVHYYGSTEIESSCNAITFVNIGTAVVTIAPIAVSLNTGQQFRIDGNIGEIDKTKYSCSFDAVGDPDLLVLTKKYAP